MRRSRPKNPARIFAGLLTGLLFAIFTLTLQPSAQTAPATGAQHLGYDKTHEITVNGTIQEVVSKSVSGSPYGLHLLLATPQGTVDAHIGPYMTKDTQAALVAGQHVQIVGAVETIHSINILLARQLIFAGRMVKVRSENGFLVRAVGPHVARSKPVGDSGPKSGLELNGGAQ